ncbi:MAG: SpoVA/SpoVAEb family sporulation membrane protein [Oscillospiraceae bacterium]|nr:SpoVA/SpoVAEb family sporulation membrane protein [Oscillospiraceae bacterium]
MYFALIRQKTLRPNLTAAEGYALGAGSKLFTIAGPVIVYGVSVSVVYGVIACPRVSLSKGGQNGYKRSRNRHPAGSGILHRPQPKNGHRFPIH